MFLCFQDNETPTNDHDCHASAVRNGKGGNNPFVKKTFPDPRAAQAELRELTDSYPNLADWEKRSEKVRKAILRGAGLAVLPKKTPED